MIFKRLIAFIIDLLIIAVIIGIFFFITQTFESQIIFLLLSALMLTLLLCKDCINGQSFGKKIMKIQVVDNKTDRKVTNFQKIVRNVFVVFWIVDFFVLYFSKYKRIGDYVAKTKVICNNETEKVKFDNSILFALLFCFCACLLFLSFIFKISRSSTLQLLF
jgi:uncharacterized RDD family membrane protein YckC